MVQLDSLGGKSTNQLSIIKTTQEGSAPANPPTLFAKCFETKTSTELLLSSRNRESLCHAAMLEVRCASKVWIIGPEKLDSNQLALNNRV